MRRRSKGFSETVFLFISFIILFCCIVYLSLFTPLSSENTWKEIKIPEGITYTQGIDMVHAGGIRINKLTFLILGRIAMIDRKLRAGYYNMNTSMTSWDIFNRIRKGMIIQYMITIPEGSTLADIKQKLQGKRLVDDVSWQIVTDRNFLTSLHIDAPSLEGYVFPDTYNFAKGVDPRDMFSMMVNRLRENFDETLRKRAEGLGLNEVQVLTIASIIEHEALLDSERPLISAVYHNRLKKGMHLQADPTVVYGIKKMQDGITRKDLKRKTLYNTYVIKGLPPGPISSPGLKSIRAALYPANVEYMFFVSKNDGTHYFSNNGEDHVKAVKLYQRSPAKPDTAPDKDTDAELFTAEGR